MLFLQGDIRPSWEQCYNLLERFAQVLGFLDTSETLLAFMAICFTRIRKQVPKTLVFCFSFRICFRI